MMYYTYKIKKRSIRLLFFINFLIGGKCMQMLINKLHQIGFRLIILHGTSFVAKYHNAMLVVTKNLDISYCAVLINEKDFKSLMIEFRRRNEEQGEYWCYDIGYIAYEMVKHKIINPYKNDSICSNACTEDSIIFSINKLIDEGLI